MPGEVLREEFLAPMGISQEALARQMDVSFQTVHRLVNGQRTLTADTAVRLARVFDTSPEFWMNLQVACDLWDAEQRYAAG
jgi:addiction module HigA family antidote